MSPLCGLLKITHPHLPNQALMKVQQPEKLGRLPKQMLSNSAQLLLNCHKMAPAGANFASV